MKIILDTNALMIPVEYGVDVLSELEEMGYDDFIVPSLVVDEIQKLRSKPATRAAAGIALALVERCRIISEEEGDKTVDDMILELARNENAAVMTLDAELQRKLRDNKIKVVFLRQGKRLST